MKRSVTFLSTARPEDIEFPKKLKSDFKGALHVMPMGTAELTEAEVEFLKSRSIPFEVGAVVAEPAPKAKKKALGEPEGTKPEEPKAEPPKTEVAKAPEGTKPEDTSAGDGSQAIVNKPTEDDKKRRNRKD